MNKGKRFLTMLTVLVTFFLAFSMNVWAEEDMGKVHSLTICGRTEKGFNSSITTTKLCSLFEDNRMPGFTKGNNLHKVYDSDENPVSKGDLFDWMDEAYGNSHSEDLNVFYYCGHLRTPKIYEDGSFDSTPENGLSLGPKRYCTFWELAERMISYEGRFVVFMDCCGSGGFIEYAYLVDPNVPDVVDQEKGRRIAVLTTTEPTVESTTMPFLGAIESNSMISGLGYPDYDALDIDEDRDGSVSLTELTQYKRKFLWKEIKVFKNYYLPFDVYMFQFAYPEIQETSVEMNCNETRQLNAVLKRSGDRDRTIYWKTSDPSVASVDDRGLVTAVKNGTAVITAYLKDGENNEIYDTRMDCTVTVKKCLSLNPSSAVVSVGASKTLTVTGNDSGKSVVWSSSSPSIATVSADGVVTGVKNGSCTVTAEVDGMKLVCSITVKTVEMEDVLNAYAQKLRQYGSKYKFALIYLNDDEIPELLVTYSNVSHNSSPNVFTWKKGKVLEITGISSDYGRLLYVPKKSVAVSNGTGNRYGETTTFVKIKTNWKTKELVRLENTVDSKTLAAVYKVNNETVSESTYNKTVQKYKKKYPYKTLNASDLFTASETNIMQMLTSYQSVVKTGL